MDKAMKGESGCLLDDSNMFEKKVIDDINRSAPSLGPFNTAEMSGFAERLVRQYGAKRVARAVEMSSLGQLQSKWVLHWIETRHK